MKKSIRMENIDGSALDKWMLNMNCLYLTIYMTKNVGNVRGCSESKENDMKDPKECGNSTKLWGVYVCRLECIPCSKVNGCAEEKVQEFVETIADRDKEGE